MNGSWRKSTFSGTNGCVEIYRKSTFSALGDCVQVSWQKSSLSAGDNCVEIANQHLNTKIRNSNHPERGMLSFDLEAMGNWISGIKNSEFDDLT